MRRGGYWEGQTRSNVAPRFSSSLLLMQRALSQERLRKRMSHIPKEKLFTRLHLENLRWNAWDDILCIGVKVCHFWRRTTKIELSFTPQMSIRHLLRQTNLKSKTCTTTTCGVDHDFVSDSANNTNKKVIFSWDQVELFPYLLSWPRVLKHIHSHHSQEIYHHLSSS